MISNTSFKHSSLYTASPSPWPFSPWSLHLSGFFRLAMMEADLVLDLLALLHSLHSSLQEWPVP
jgi:hypothetical protein